MRDLTKNTTPYGLLDAETQKALRENGGPIQYYTSYGDWVVTMSPSFTKNVVYRITRAAPKPREWWVISPAHRTGGLMFSKRSDAEEHGWPDDKIVHVREVIE